MKINLVSVMPYMAYDMQKEKTILIKTKIIEYGACVLHDYNLRSHKKAIMKLMVLSFFKTV